MNWKLAAHAAVMNALWATVDHHPRKWLWIALNTVVVLWFIWSRRAQPQESKP